MHADAGAHVFAFHCAHVPSTTFAHDRYVRCCGSNMQPSAGAHGPPKWKQMPAPPDRHVKYAAAPAWNTQVGFGQPTSGTIATAADEPEPAVGALCAEALPFAAL